MADTDNTKQNEQVSLPKSINLLSAVAIIIGTIIGTGIFMSPHTIVENVESVGATMLVWLLTGFLAWMGALCYLEFGLMISKSGAEYAYLQYSFGNLVAYVISFVYTLVIKPVAGAIIAVTFADYLSADYFGEEKGVNNASMQFLKEFNLKTL